MVNVHSWGPVPWRLTSFSNNVKMVIDHLFWAGRQFGAWLIHRKEVSASLEITPPQWKVCWVSLISRALPSLTLDNRGHFISARLWIQPTQNLLSPDSQFWATDHVYFVWILDLWLLLLRGRFSYFADRWRKFGFPCVQKTANCDFRWLVHFLSKLVWILLFFSQLSFGNMLFPKNHLSFQALTQFFRSSSLGWVSRDTICCWNWKVTLALKDAGEGEGGKKAAWVEAQVST